MISMFHSIIQDWPDHGEILSRRNKGRFYPEVIAATLLRYYRQYSVAGMLSLLYEYAVYNAAGVTTSVVQKTKRPRLLVPSSTHFASWSLTSQYCLSSQ